MGLALLPSAVVSVPMDTCAVGLPPVAPSAPPMATISPLGNSARPMQQRRAGNDGSVHHWPLTVS